MPLKRRGKNSTEGAGHAFVGRLLESKKNKGLETLKHSHIVHDSFAYQRDIFLRRLLSRQGDVFRRG